jgi:hypothetical protein
VIVYSNTTPFIALASIGQLELLPKIFGKVHVAEAVIDECAEGGRVLVPNLRQLDWIVPVADDNDAALTVLFELDRGEKQTILLARKHNAQKVIIDERIGRGIAEYLGLNVTGTLGVLAKAKTLGVIDSFKDAALGMQRQGIYYNTQLIQNLAQHLGEQLPMCFQCLKCSIRQLFHFREKYWNFYGVLGTYKQNKAECGNASHPLFTSASLTRT